MTTTLADLSQATLQGLTPRTSPRSRPASPSKPLSAMRGGAGKEFSAIREWAEEVSKKYHPIVEVIRVAEMDGKTIVSGRVSGDFPGSPVELRYVFTLDGEKIARLEIS